MTFAEKTFRAVRWSAIDQFATQGIQLAVFFIMARLVPKEAFGLIALTMVFCAFFLIFARKGFDDAIIQRDELDDLSLNTAFWSSGLFGLLLTAVCVAISPLIAAAFNEPRIVAILSVLALNLFFGAWSAVPIALLRREMSFKPLAIRNITARSIGGGIGVALAYQGYGVWSLVASQVLGEFVSMILLFWASSYRPRFQFCRVECRRYISFGGRIIAAQLMNFFNRRYDTMIVGKFFGMETLGIYAISMKLIDFSVYTIMGIVGQVGYPIMCRLKGLDSKFENFSIALLSLISSAITPIVMVLVFFPEFWINLFFGPKWVEAIPIISLLAPLLLVKLTSWTEVLGITAMGRPDRRLHLATLFAAISVSLLTIGANLGFYWFVLFATIRYFLMVPATTWSFCQISNVGLGRLVRLQFLPIIGGVLLYGVGSHFYTAHPVSGILFQLSLQILASLFYLSWLYLVFCRDQTFIAGSLILKKRFSAFI